MSKPKRNLLVLVNKEVHILESGKEVINLNIWTTVRQLGMQTKSILDINILLFFCD